MLIYLSRRVGTINEYIYIVGPPRGDWLHRVPRRKRGNLPRVLGEKATSASRRPSPRLFRWLAEPMEDLVCVESDLELAIGRNVVNGHV
jgi:hypothetical protein